MKSIARWRQKYLGDSNPKQVIAYAFFDFANSANATLILSLVFPIYFREVVAGGGARADFWWGFMVSVSILLGAFLSPVIGSMADFDTRKKIKFVVATLIAITASALLYFTGPNLIVFAAVVFIIANAAFEVAQTIYDSFLAYVANKRNFGRISSLAWGFGYLGGVTAMLLFRPFYGQGFAGEFDAMYRLTFPLTALFFLVFSWPAFYWLQEPPSLATKISWLASIKASLERIRQTIKNIKAHKQIGIFMLGYYFMSDALVTAFVFLPIFATVTLRLSLAEIIPVLILAQVLAFPATVFFGYLADKKGAKKILLSTLSVWAIIVVMISIATKLWHLYIVAVLTSLVIGSSQAIARSWLAKLVPEEKRFEFFGFNGFATKIAATAGPLVFGAISAATGNQRLAVLALLPFFLVAFILFARVDEEVI